MASQGEIIFKEIVARLSEKATSRFITGRDTQKIGRYFWAMVTEEFKQQQRTEYGKEAFWQFALLVKACLVNKDLESIYSLYLTFDQNALNYFENIYTNCVKNMVDSIL